MNQYRSTSDETTEAGKPARTLLQFMEVIKRSN